MNIFLIVRNKKILYVALFSFYLFVTLNWFFTFYTHGPGLNNNFSIFTLLPFLRCEKNVRIKAQLSQRATLLVCHLISTQGHMVPDIQTPVGLSHSESYAARGRPPGGLVKAPISGSHSPSLWLSKFRVETENLLFYKLQSDADGLGTTFWEPLY